MSRVKVLVTGIKIESKQSKVDQGIKNCYKSIDQEHTAAI